MSSVLEVPEMGMGCLGSLSSLGHDDAPFHVHTFSPNALQAVCYYFSWAGFLYLFWVSWKV